MTLHPAEALPSLEEDTPVIVQGQEAPDIRLHDPCDPHFESFGESLEDVTTRQAQDIEMGATSRTVAAGHNPRCYMTRPEWLAKLEMTTDLVEMGCLLAWGYISGLVPELSPRAEPARLPAPRKRSGELFPLPVLAPSLDELGDDGGTAEQKFELIVSDAGLRSAVRQPMCCTNANRQAMVGSQEKYMSGRWKTCQIK